MLHMNVSLFLVHVLRLKLCPTIKCWLARPWDSKLHYFIFLWGHAPDSLVLACKSSKHISTQEISTLSWPPPPKSFAWQSYKVCGQLFLAIH